jgi:hypothetical protein
MNDRVVGPLPALAARPLHPPSRLALDRFSESQRSFAFALGRAGTIRPAQPQTPAERARESAEQFIAQTLILPLLKQLRESNHAAPPFAPTSGEKQFAALQDAETAQRIAHATRFPLVDRVARDLLRRAGRDAAEPAAALTPIPSPVAPSLGVIPRASS